MARMRETCCIDHFTMCQLHNPRYPETVFQTKRSKEILVSRAGNGQLSAIRALRMCAQQATTPKGRTRPIFCDPRLTAWNTEAGAAPGLLAVALVDDLLSDGLRNLSVGVEHHGEVRAARGGGTQVADVAEHLG